MQKSVVITSSALKGGVGKSHLAWLLCGVCEEQSLRCLVIDVDAQANISGTLLPEKWGAVSIEALFDPSLDVDPRTLIRHTRFPSIDVIPASPLLARFDVADQGEWGKKDLHFTLVDAVRQIRGDYSLILIDTPPRLSLVTFAAYCASDGVICPLEPADWGALGTTLVTATVRHVQQHHNPGLRLLGFVASRFKRARVAQQTYLKELRRQFGGLSFDTVVPDLAAFEKSVASGVPVVQMAPRSEEANLARQLFKEVINRVQGNHSSADSGGRTGVRDDTRPAA
jgi:chromosome partitioning protein